MILTGRSLCLPSSATVQELFLVARDASILPEISLDPALTTFLSLDSSAALRHQYAVLRRSMSGEQQAAFSHNLTQRLGGSTKVTYGGVGVVALALSLIFDQVSQQVGQKCLIFVFCLQAISLPRGLLLLLLFFLNVVVSISLQVRGTERTTGSADLPAQRSQAQDMFAISRPSRIGWIMHRYLELIPDSANDEEKMAQTTEIFDELLNLELLDHYERMTTKKRMSTEAMQQWLTGAAFHLHMRIHQVGRCLLAFNKRVHYFSKTEMNTNMIRTLLFIVLRANAADLMISQQVRLNSIPVGAAESLRRSFKAELNQLIEHYKVYLRRNIQETAAPGPGKPKSRQSSVFKPSSAVNRTGPARSGTGQIASSTATGKTPQTNASDAAADKSRKCVREVLGRVSGRNVTKANDGGPAGREKRKKLSGAAGVTSGAQGLLVIEPLRNVSHSVQHHPCEAPAIQQALLARIMAALDMEQNKEFFQFSARVFHSLLRQKDDFDL